MNTKFLGKTLVASALVLTTLGNRLTFFILRIRYK
ncbi:Uncharacterised protein [Staphylococcus aureus]|nr:Uncharacterised protein [Staphylococcus aureus]